LVSQLPVELHVTIVVLLHVKDVISMAQVSKMWKQVAYLEIVWKKICERDWQKLLSNPVIKWREEYILLLRQYRISRTEDSEEHQRRMYHRHWMLCGVHTFHPVNGRRGFDLLPPPENVANKPPVEVMEQMLKREDELRLSKEVQELFSNPGFDTIHVAAQVQERVVKEFGFKNIEETVQMIRSAPLLYPECPEIRRIPHYIKFNRSQQGSLQCADTIPDARLSYLDGSPVSLHSYMSKLFDNKKPLVINAGSYT